MKRRAFVDAPSDAGWFMPAEWWPHTRCWMAWPSREDIWHSWLEPARKDVAAVAQAIADFEPVSMIASPAAVSELKVLAFAGPLVIEGGNLCSDGEGTLLTSKTAILDPKRNPGLKRGEAEERLRAYLGVKKVIWLPGNKEDTVTGGHVDGIACFCRPGVVIAEMIEDKNGPESKALAECRQVLEDEATDAQGRKFTIKTLTRPRRVPSRSKYFCSSYLNFYIANGGIIMPKFGDDRADEAARQVVAEAFPGRRVVQLRIDTIAKGGGGIHCITQQQPSGRQPA